MKRSLRLALPALTLAALSCSRPPSENPASLWLSHGTREVDLVLVDHEPPPF